MIQTLLNGNKACACGRAHTCDIKHVVVRPGAVEALSTLCAEYSNILLVADENTYATCGDRVVEILGAHLADKIVFPGDTILIPNEDAIARVEEVLTSDTDLILGIGSGVVNDLCKHVSFCHDLRYFIVATAPSMDGYASVGAAMITENMKTTFNARVPAVIIGDVDVLKTAPMRMIQSGFGDIIGKYSALNDWKLAKCVNDEYFCDEIYNLVYDTVLKTEALADGIQTRDETAIQTLMEALVIVGIAMSFVGNSRPASGSEHHLSHYFEIVGILNSEEYFLHGIDVAYSTVVTQKMREELLALEGVRAAYSHDVSVWEEEIRKRYGAASDGVIALQKKCGFYDKDYETIYREKWDEIRTILSEVPSSEKITEILRVAGLDFSEFEELYGMQKIDDCIWYAKDLKDRYTVLWLYFLLCKK
ncbi:MAG: sn-glycerol-1-phosphate dehydrogenase [Ruminococcaceae bacterium]|nr:sn-glycerol-1-phosphate dehydrogenase [Oscillospiraceae bacterium]